MKEFNKMTFEELVNYMAKEYEVDKVLPSDYEKTIDRLEGYVLAKRGSDESFILNHALTLLREAQHFFSTAKRLTDWKFRE